MELEQQRHFASLLLVDDNPLNIHLLTLSLRDYGFIIMTAANGEEALKLLESHKPDLILLDIRMPIMDGFETCRHLKEKPETKEIPVIFLTAANNLEDKLTAFALGAVDYMNKPILSEEVIARITVHLSQARLQKSLTERLRAYEQRFKLAAPKSSSEPSSTKEIDRRLKRVYQAQNILLNQMDSSPTIEELAKIIGTNRTKLTQDFHILFGMSVFNWLREQRLLEACRLLRETSLSIQIVGEKVGYNRVSHFTVAFKKRFDCSPTAYRKQTTLK